MKRPNTAPAGRATQDENPNNITVAVRVRPENQQEQQDTRWRTVIRVLDEHVLIFDPNNATPRSSRGSITRAFTSASRSRETRYSFDRVFDQFATQQDIYENTTKDLIPFVTNGFNATVFAYGATGAGKTHTMIGNENSGPGVMVLTMRDLFLEVEKNRGEKEYQISVSYLEVYNETIRDLLVENSKPLDLREDPEKGTFVAGLSERNPSSADEVFQMLAYGNGNRRQSPTEANATSSRSHAVLQIMIRQKERTADIKSSVKVGKLSLIDLAGSERAAVTKNRGDRLVEGANINKSLLALGNCINALGEGYKKGSHVPYRNSKLTRMLKDSLGGNCRTVMIANVSPSSSCYEDTHNTLKYSNRAKNIQTKVTRNVLDVNVHISQYVNLIKELRTEISELKLKVQVTTRQNQQLQAQAKLPPINSAPKQEDGEEEQKELQELKDAIQSNMSDTLTLKKNLSQIDSKIREARREMKKRNRTIRSMEHTFRATGAQPSAAETADLLTLRNQADNYYHNWKEYQNLSLNVMKKLEKNDEWRRKLVMDEIPSRLSSQASRNTALLHARACALELDKYDLGERIVSERSQISAQSDEIDKLRSAMSFIMPLFKEQFKVLQENNLLTPKMEQDFSSANILMEDVAENSTESPTPSPFRPPRNSNNSSTYTSSLTPTRPTRASSTTPSKGSNYYPKTPTFNTDMFDHEIQRMEALSHSGKRNKSQHHHQPPHHHQQQHHQPPHHHYQQQQQQQHQQPHYRMPLARVQPSPGTAIDQAVTKVNLMLAKKGDHSSGAINVNGKQLKPALTHKEHPYNINNTTMPSSQHHPPPTQHHTTRSHNNPLAKYTKMVGRPLDLPPISTVKDTVGAGGGGREKDKENILKSAPSAMMVNNHRKSTATRLVAPDTKRLGNWK